MRTRNAMQLKTIIRNRAKDEGVPAQLVMQNYLLERLLERIPLSPWRDCVVIKGGMLISLLVGVGEIQGDGSSVSCADDMPEPSPCIWSVESPAGRRYFLPKYCTLIGA